MMAFDRCDQCGAVRAPWQLDKNETRCPYHADPFKSCDGTLRSPEWYAEHRPGAATARTDWTWATECTCQTCEYEHKAWHEDKHVAAQRERILKIIEEMHRVRLSAEEQERKALEIVPDLIDRDELIRRIKEAP